MTAPGDLRHWFERIAAALTRRPGQHPTAFSGLRAVCGTGLQADDGARRFAVPWTSIRRVQASMGRQAYDMTRILTVDHAAGRSIFLPEAEPLWAPFITAMAAHLPGAVPEPAWTARLAADPGASVLVYRRSRRPAGLRQLDPGV